MRAWILFFSFFLVASLNAESDFERDQIQERISPVGKVHIAEDSVQAPPAPQAPAPSATPDNKSPGEATFDQYCVVCHRDGVAGAPKAHNATDWEPRLAKKNIDELTASAVKGLNAMPPKGTCQSCTEADIKAAIEFMVPKK